VGVVYAIGEYAGQPEQTSLYGQETFVADLSVYRDAIEQTIAMPEPASGLAFGLAALALLERRSRRGVSRRRSPSGC
jgi:hypothetical protein